MKKLWLMLAVMIFTVSLLACGKKEEIIEGFPENDSMNWGIDFSVKNISKLGLTVVYTQSGGNAKGELIYGEEYKLYSKNNGEWVPVPYILEEFGWDSVGYMIQKDDTVEQELYWEWIYGDLKTGTYMLEKEIMDSWDEGYEKSLYYVEFEID